MSDVKVDPEVDELDGFDPYDIEAISKIPRLKSTRLYVKYLERNQVKLLKQFDAIDVLLNPDSDYAKHLAAIRKWTTVDALKVIAEVDIPDNQLMDLKGIRTFLEGQLDMINEELNDAHFTRRIELEKLVQKVKLHVLDDQAQQPKLNKIREMLKDA